MCVRDCLHSSRNLLLATTINDDYQHNSRANQPSAASDVNRGERNESPAAYNDDYQHNSRVNQPSLASAARDMNRVRGGAQWRNESSCCLLQMIINKRAAPTSPVQRI